MKYLCFSFVDLNRRWEMTEFIYEIYHLYTALNIIFFLTLSQ